MLSKFLTSSKGVFLTGFVITIMPLLFFLTLHISNPFIIIFPLYISWMILLIGIPWLADTWQWGNILLFIRQYWMRIFLWGILTIVFIKGFHWIYNYLLINFNLVSSSYDNFIRDIIIFWKITKKIIKIPLLLLLIEAIGEECFYRGYIQERITILYREETGIVISTFSSSLIYIFPYLFSLSKYIVAFVFWSIFIICLEGILALSYNKSRSLYSPLFLHYICIILGGKLFVAVH